MKNVRLGELFDFLPKSKLPAGEGKTNGEYEFYTSSPTLTKYTDHYQFQGEHLIFGTGGNASIHYNNRRFSVSTDCLVTKPGERELLNAKYAYYYIKNNINILESGFRGAGLQHITRAYIENILIPLPSFSIQNQIVAVIDKAVNILQHSNSLIGKLDELKESIYLSSFGIKADDYNSWETAKLEKIVSENGRMRTGPFGSDLLHSQFTSAGEVLVLGLDNVSSNYFRNSARFITAFEYEPLKNYRVYPRDLLVGLMGTGTTGKSAVVPDEIPLAINTKHLAAITLNTRIANPYYVSSAIQFDPSIINQIERKNKGAVIPGINLTVVKGLKLKIPPISEQNHFEKIIRKIEDTLKYKIWVHRKQAELLIESISHYAFKGNLKTNLEAFTFDDRVVDYVEKEYNKKNSASADRQLDQIKRLIQNVFNTRSFTFTDLDAAIKDSNIEIEYEYPTAERRRGIKDFVFDALNSNGSSKALLKQEFELDKNRDAEKGIDNSRIVFSLNI